ncbi:MAG: cobalamin biosynthesis protein CbiG [Hyphomonadaceae bacterium]
MARLFDAYVIVDWSAASKPTTGADSIWICALKRDVRFRLTPVLHNPPTRAEAAALLRQMLADFARLGERALVGFDFPLGFPRGAAAALNLQKAPPWRAMLDFVAAEMRDKPDNTNNRFQIAAKMNRLMTGEAFPFWGAPARDEQTTLKAKRVREHHEGDLPEFRYAEAALKGVQSIWKTYYQGSVGGQALTGMPIVRQLKEAGGDRIRIWPFETGWRALHTEDLDGVEAVFAEVWPSMLASSPAAGEVKDAAQVRALAQHFAALDEQNRLAALFGPQKHAAPREVVENEEGWILGG